MCVCMCVCVGGERESARKCERERERDNNSAPQEELSFSSSFKHQCDEKWQTEKNKITFKKLRKHILPCEIFFEEQAFSVKRKIQRTVRDLKG